MPLNSYVQDYFYAIVVAIITLVITIILSILVFTKVMPKDKQEKLPKFLKFLAKIFNFESLLLEKILKFLYVFCTIFCVIFGFLLTFWFDTKYGVSWAGKAGPFVMILGPIAFRIIYELMMLFLLLVKNTSDINKKLSEKKD